MTTIAEKMSPAARAACGCSEKRDETLTTITVKVPRWVEDQFRRVAIDADLKPGEAYRIGLSKLASFLFDHWRRGPALSIFLEHISFIDSRQYNIFFDRRGK